MFMIHGLQAMPFEKRERYDLLLNPLSAYQPSLCAGGPLVAEPGRFWNDYKPTSKTHSQEEPAAPRK